MEHIKQVINGWMRDLTLQKSAQKGSNPEEWLSLALTKRQMRHIKVKYFRKGILGLNVDSSSWLYTFSLQKEGLLRQLQGQAPALKDIRFSVGEVQ